MCVQGSFTSFFVFTRFDQSLSFPEETLDIWLPIELSPIKGSDESVQLGVFDVHTYCQLVTFDGHWH